MALRVSKRLLRVALLVVSVLGIFGLVLHTTNSEITTYYVDKTKELVDSQKSWWNSEAAKSEESERKKAEQDAAEGKHLQDVELDDAAKKLEEDATKKLEEVVGGEGNGDSKTTPLKEKEPESTATDTKTTTVKAAFVSLVRNQDLQEIVETVRNLEDRFNSKFHYPYVFLNNEPFTPEFKSAISNVISSTVDFGLIPPAHWSYPEWIDQEKAATVRQTADYIYGDSESYRHMCRYESGFFWRHELLDKFDWYWRVEPSTKLHCNVDYDVFQWMQDNNKMYGFTVSIKEFESTIKTLWSTTKEFLDANPKFIAKDNMMDFISNDKGKTYNLCHFWSNFEVANLNFWRSEAYQEYFDYLDKKGGFFYERWGDAPVHSIAASLFLSSDQVHYFPDIGYFHNPYNNCPLDQSIWQKGKCSCEPMWDFTFQTYSCTNEYYDFKKLKKPDGWKKFRN
ncbi:LAME_0H08614g1_1 [Lachancea meyersii CBS 8951]|uniref:LAME_0H08614g1_1 n=1 Tax=Lachancea meyersii CBS 8951 TaxID=1266667 RepID=A0A1G4KFL3_9SACH|nr:LAME_0H08614g1_1 [Lachancea meyersii CBS 8951]